MIYNNRPGTLPGKESVRRIRRMTDAFMKQPKLFSQNEFPSGDSPEQICTAPGCSAGWAVWEDMPQPKFVKFVQEVEEKTGLFAISRAWEARAAKALRLPEDAPVQSLFGTASEWPDIFTEGYLNASTPEQRAQVANARWEYYIATGR